MEEDNNTNVNRSNHFKAEYYLLKYQQENNPIILVDGLNYLKQQKNLVNYDNAKSEIEAEIIQLQDFINNNNFYDDVSTVLTTLNTKSKQEEDKINFIGYEIKEQEHDLKNKTSSKAEKPLESIFLSYEQHLEQGNQYFTGGTLQQLEKAEYAYAKALRISDRERNLTEQVIVMQKMGDVYLEYGKKGEKGENFTKAIALYNAAIARSDHSFQKEVLVHRTKYAERLFLEKVFKRPITVSLISTQKSDKEHKAFLEELRAYCRKKLEKLDKVCNPSLEENDERREQLYQQRAREIQELYHHIAEEMKRFVRLLLDECKEVLEPPPCKYAVLGLGSLAKEEMTPYSDFEWAILIEDDKEEYKQYFRQLATLLHIKVINLGETILPSMSIKSLNDHYSEDKLKDWFYDAITTRGFSFDGAMPWASKSPLGRHPTTKNPWEIELLNTPEKLAEYQTIESEVKEGYRLANILAVSTLIEGTEELFGVYDNKVQFFLSQPISEEIHNYMKRMYKLTLKGEVKSFPAFTSIRQARASFTLAEDIKRYGMRLSNSEEGKLYEVKKEIYRLPSTLIEGLSFYYGLQEKIGKQRIETLPLSSGFSSEEKQYLQVILGIATEFRLKNYLANCGQREIATISTTTEKQEAESLQRKFNLKAFEIGERGPLFRFYATVFPLQKFILQLMVIGIEEDREPFYDITASTKTLIHQRLLQYNQARIWAIKALEDNFTSANLTTLGIILFKLGEPRECISKLEQAYQIRIKKYGDDHYKTIIALENLGHAYSALGDYRKQVECYEKVLQIYAASPDSMDSEAIASIQMNLGIAHASLGNYHEQIQYHEKALDLRRALFGKSHRDIAAVLNSLGCAYGDLGDYHKQIEYQEEALSIQKKCLDERHPEMAAILHNLGNAYGKVNNYSKQIEYYERALAIQETLFGRKSLNVAEILDALGSACCNLGDYYRQLQYQEEALQIAESCCGRSHPTVARIIINLGVGHGHLGDIRKQIMYQEEALEIERKFSSKKGLVHTLIQLSVGYAKLGKYYKQIEYLTEIIQILEQQFGRKHPQVADALNNLGLAYSDLGQPLEQIKYQNEALKIYEQYFSRNHTSVATVLDNLGIAYHALKQYSKQIEYQEEALSIRLQLLGKDHPDVAIVLLNLGNAYGGLKNYLKQCQYQEKALLILEKRFGRAYLDVANVLDNLGNAYGNLGKYDKQIESQKEALQIFEKCVGRNCPSTALAIYNLSTGYKAINELDKASDYCKEAYTIFFNHLGLEHHYTKTAKAFLDKLSTLSPWQQRVSFPRTSSQERS